MRRPARFAFVLLGVAATAVGAQTKTPAKPADTPAAHERAIMTALEKDDYAAFNEALGADITYIDGKGIAEWKRAKSAEMLKPCKTSKLTISDLKERPVGTDVMVVTYSVTGNQVCNGEKTPPVHAMSVWHKVGTRWVAVAHSETPVTKK